MNDEDRPEVLDRCQKANVSIRTWYADRYRLTMELFAALEKAGRDDPVAVAYAMEGMTSHGPHGDTITMRADDHQIVMPMCVSYIDTDAKTKFEYGGKTFGIGWKTDGWVSPRKYACRRYVR